MGVIEAIKKGFGVATKNLALVAVLFIFNVIWNLASIPLVKAGPNATPQLTATTMVFSLLFILVSIFFQGGSLGIVRDYIKQGKAGLAQLISYGLKYYLRLFGLGLLIVLVIAIAGIVAALLVAATAPLNNAVVTIIAAVIAVIIGAIALYFILLLILSPYVLVCDELGIIEAMKKSINTVRKAIGRTLLLLVLLILISLGIGFIIGFLTGLVTVAMPVAAAQVVIGVVNSLFNGYLGVVMMAAFMAFYFALVEKVKVG